MVRESYSAKSNLGVSAALNFACCLLHEAMAPEFKMSRAAFNSHDSTYLIDRPSQCLWEIDGANEAGTRYYAVPTFARGKPPLRIDVYIPNLKEQPEALRDVFGPVANLFTGTPKVDTLEISQSLVPALQSWSVKIPDFKALYEGMPFGSQIVFETFSHQIRDEQIHILPIYNVEKQWMSVKQLHDAWRLPPESWPEVVELEELQLQRHLHDSISVVRIRGKETDEFIFKAVTGDLKYFYHELRTLLSMPLHPNIISRPLYMITKRCHFGGKIGVCGMILKYHPLGSLSQMLKNRFHSAADYQSEISWAKQIVTALLHIQENGPGFYTGLKLTNIVLGQSEESKIPHIILIDFEQRLGKPSWTPPELHFPTYLSDLALKSSQKPVRERYSELLLKFNVDFTTRDGSTKYTNTKHGFCDPWPSLSRLDQEAAQVYMFGKLLWCLFERATDIDNYCGINLFRQHSQNLNFPCFEQTPQAIRGLILRCTAGSAESREAALPVVVRQNRIWPRVYDGPLDEISVMEDVQVIAAHWWKCQIAEAEEYLVYGKHSDLGKLIETRPTLREVLRALEEL